ncbi:hypothetical protein B0H34DRAFT_690813 [Crassisporium funariophilum]|nr:hypothetical protein B0H34DRAFT_690813 [Crassisporium funariophilum]
MSNLGPSEGYDRSISLAIRQLWNRRFSNASFTSASSFGSLASQLPEYSAMDSETPSELDGRSIPTGDTWDSTLHHQSDDIEEVSRTPRYSYVPPRYSTLPALPNTPDISIGEVLHFEHSFPINSNKLWATLHTFSRQSIPGTIGGAQARPKLPRVWGSEPVAGLLELNLERSQTIQQIRLTIRGTIATGSLEGDSDIFLEHEVIIWNQSMGDPRSASADPTTAKKKTDGKLTGSHQFPFSFPFPIYVDLLSASSKGALPTPLLSHPKASLTKPSSSHAVGSITQFLVGEQTPSLARSILGPFSASTLRGSIEPTSPPSSSSRNDRITPFPIDEKTMTSDSSLPLAAEVATPPPSSSIVSTITPFPLDEKFPYQHSPRRTHHSIPALPTDEIASSARISAHTQGSITPFPLNRQQYVEPSSLHATGSTSRSPKSVKLASASSAENTVAKLLPPNLVKHLQHTLEPDVIAREKQQRRRSTLPLDLITRSVAKNATSTVSPAPQSFLEQGISASIRYELAVRIIHGRLRQDSKIKTNITYIPSTVPPPASLRRQQAYDNGISPPGPSIDPDGWLALPLTAIKGEFGGIGGRKVKIDCQLYLAKPLSYTRGVTIPCYLTLSSDDSGALSMLSTPKAPHIRLMRRLNYLCQHSGDAVDALYETGNSPGNLALFGPSASLVPVVARNSGQAGVLKTSTTEISKGVWWVPARDTTGIQESCVRHLEGEIHLDKDLQPSCSCPIFTVEYFIEMLPLISSVFEPVLNSGAEGDATEQVIIHYPVDVVTMLAQQGPPVPSAFSEARQNTW